MFNNLMNVWYIVREYGHHQLREAVEVLAMGRRGSEPREFKNEQLKQLLVVIFMN
jgi:hypothetical protein